MQPSSPQSSAQKTNLGDLLRLLEEPIGPVPVCRAAFLGRSPSKAAKPAAVSAEGHEVGEVVLYSKAKEILLPDFLDSLVLGGQISPQRQPERRSEPPLCLCCRSLGARGLGPHVVLTFFESL